MNIIYIYIYEKSKAIAQRLNRLDHIIQFNSHILLEILDYI